jgi:pSer/pThr/pTyr-binding forkhead associated (FHA) protein
MRTSENYIKIEEILGNVKTKVLNSPCPYCGRIYDDPPKLGEKVRCKSCGNFYGIESSLEETSATALKNLVSEVLRDAVGAFGKTLDSNSTEFGNKLEAYANQVFQETRRLYTKLERLPSMDELDGKMENATHRTLEMFAKFSESYLDGQKVMTERLEAVMGRIVSVQIRFEDLRKMMEESARKTEKPSIPTNTVSLIYHDLNGTMRRIKVQDASIGRNEHGINIQARCADGSVQDLGVLDPTVSKKHIRMRVNNGVATLTDVGSSYGTFINGRKIRREFLVRVHEGDRIRIGENTAFKITYRTRGNERRAIAKE